MTQLEQMKDSLAGLGEMIANEKLRQEVLLMLLPMSVFLKKVVDDSPQQIKSDIQLGVITSNDLVELSQFIEEMTNVYLSLIYTDGVKGKADINTGYIMDIENSLSSFNQILKAYINKDESFFHPSTANIERVKTSINNSLINAANDTKNGDISFFEVH